MYFDRETLARWSEPPIAGDRYLRPIVCRGTPKPGGVAVVGLNPATAIGPGDVNFKEYLGLLLNVGEFEKFYRDLRIQRGKSPTSPTRTGLQGIARWLAPLGWDFVAETNVSPYPTCSGEELDTVPDEFQSRWVFREVIHALSPRLMILHGEDALNEFTSSLAVHIQPAQGIKFTTLVKSPLLGEVNWSNGTRCKVYVCPHLRFFGKAGGTRFLPLQKALGL